MRNRRLARASGSALPALPQGTRPQPLHRQDSVNNLHYLQPLQRALEVPPHRRFLRETEHLRYRPLMPLRTAHVPPPASTLERSAAFSRLNAAISRRTAESSLARAISTTPSRDGRRTPAGFSRTAASCPATIDKRGLPAPVNRFWELSGRTDGLAFPVVPR